MKLLFSLSLLFCCIISFSQTEAEAAIRQAMQRQTEAWNRADIEGFMQTYWKSDSLMFIGSKGITYGWDSTLAHYKKGYPDKAAMGKLSFKLKVIKALSDEYYFVVGKFLLERSIGNVSGHFDLLFRKTNGTWLIITDHSS